MKQILKRFFNANLSVKFIMYYLTIFILFATLCFFTFKRLGTNMVDQKVKQISSENLQSINSNLGLIINTADNQSKTLISSSTLQSALETGKAVGDQKQMDSYLSESINFYDAISSIYIFGFDGREYFVDNQHFKNITIPQIEAQKWYPKLKAKAGGYLLKLNGGGLFEEKNRNYISMIREIYNINTQKSIGIMIINISEDYIDSSLGKSDMASGMGIMISDENNKPIFHSGGTANKIFADVSKDTDNRKGSEFEKIGGKQYIITSLKNDYNWTIATVTPTGELAVQTQTYNIFILVLALIIIAMFVVAITFSSISITKPIKKLAKAMGNMKDGSFTEVHVSNKSDEIGRLQNVYNIMVNEIKDLFEDMISEQKAKRKAELEALQTQIKPHFLYNSFDAISSLALSGENKEVYRLVKALGKFYRAFLNTGSEMVTVRQELEMIKQYVTIQQIRLGDKFSVNWDTAYETLDFKIPRLTLQPLVENAVKHGIKPKATQGIITISTRPYGKGIVLAVADDGGGMDTELIKKLLSGESGGSGIKITRERLKLYFDAPSFEIISQKGCGSTFRITLPGKTEN